MKMTNLAPSLDELMELVTRKTQALLPSLGRPLRYGIYTRKSTDDPEKQVRSLDDQIAECREFGQRKNLQITLEYPAESVSAKISGKRPVFKKMLADIRAHKIDGIIAWSVDRLSRNLKEAGELMDLLEDGTLKDLKLVNFAYDGSAASKMTLGMQFVLAKQYSDNLQENVNRGIKRSIGDGRGVGKSKHGYYRDTNLHYRPTAYHSLIKQAWDMRAEGKTYQEIANFLNRAGYQKVATTDGSKFASTKMDLSKLHVMFRDPFYVGIYQHGDHVTNLYNAYDFRPATTMDIFYQVNRGDPNGLFHRSWKKNLRIKREIQAYFLQNMVICGECNKKLYAGITTKRTKSGKETHYYYLRCLSLGCPFHNKSVRAKVITDFVYAFLDSNPFLETEKAWKKYRKDLMKWQQDERNELLSAQRENRAKIVDHQRKLERAKDQLYSTSSEILKKEYEGDLVKFSREVLDLEAAQENISEALAELRQAPLSFAEYIATVTSLPQKVREADTLGAKDFYIRQIFSNFTIFNKKVIAITLAEPVADLLEVNTTQNKNTTFDGVLVLGRGERI